MFSSVSEESLEPYLYRFSLIQNTMIPAGHFLFYKDIYLKLFFFKTLFWLDLNDKLNILIWKTAFSLELGFIWKFRNFFSTLHFTIVTDSNIQLRSLQLEKEHRRKKNTSQYGNFYKKMFFKNSDKLSFCIKCMERN